MSWPLHTSSQSLGLLWLSLLLPSYCGSDLSRLACNRYSPDNSTRAHPQPPLYNNDRMTTPSLVQLIRLKSPRALLVCHARGPDKHRILVLVGDVFWVGCRNSGAWSCLSRTPLTQGQAWFKARALRDRIRWQKTNRSNMALGRLSCAHSRKYKTNVDSPRPLWHKRDPSQG